jgi:hypothetical protein
MNVYKINELYIAAKDADVALGYYLDETTSIDDTFYGELDEGEIEEFSISIKRLTTKAMNNEFITCCWDGCSECEDKDEPVLYSPVQIIAKNTDFPRVVCKEE